MNTKISLKRISVATVTGSIVMLVLVPLLAGALPNAMPTGGNVDASFNTVKVGYGITAPSVSVDIKGLNIGINAEATDAINSTGGEFFGHSNGVLGESLSLSGTGVRGTGKGPTGYGIQGYNRDINGTAGLFQQAGMKNSVFLATPAEALRAKASGAGMPAIYADSSSGHAIEAFAADNSKVGITSQGGFAGGQFLNRNNVSDNFVFLGTLTKAISAIGPISNNTWEVSKTGAISSPQEPIGASSYIFANSTACTDAGGTSVVGVACTLPIRLFDNEGIKIGNNAGSVNLEINGTTGAISNPGTQNGGAVKIADDQGFEVANTAGTVEFAVSSDGKISNPRSPGNNPIKLQDYIVVYDSTGVTKISIDNDLGSINASGNLSSSGAISATGDIGTVNGTIQGKNVYASTYMQSSGNIYAGGNITTPSTVNAGYVDTNGFCAGPMSPYTCVDDSSGQLFVKGVGGTDLNTYDFIVGRNGYTSNSKMYGALDVTSSVTTTGNINASGNANITGTLYTGHIKSDDSVLHIEPGTNTEIRMDYNTLLVDSINNRVGIRDYSPSYALDVAGDAAKTTGGTTWIVSSDERLKDIEGDYEKGLKEIIQLEPIKFHYKKDNPLDLPSDEENVGLIAQAVQKIFPEAISVDDDGYLHLGLHSINVAVINAIKELKAEKDADVAALKAETEALRAEVAELKAQVEELKSLFAN